MKKTIALLAVLTLMTSCISCNYKITRDTRGISTTKSISIGKSNSQSTLSHVAYHDDDVEVRKAAVKKLTIQSALSHVAYHDNDVEVRKAAVKKLTIQSALSHVAYHDKDSEVRKLAIEKLN